MNLDTNRKQQAEHLVHVRTLIKAVSSAIAAIEKNDLREFESHLAVQETICNRLAANPWTQSSTGTDASTAGDENLAEVRAAHIELAHLNRVYAGLLKRAHRSANLMAALYRNHVPAPQCHTWSCEV